MAIETHTHMNTQSKPLSGFQRRKLREAKGIPRYTKGEAEGRKAHDARRAAQRHKENQAIARQIKLESGCVDCGYDAHVEALEFDHLPGNEKVSDIARLVGLSRTSKSRLLAEIAKCEVVCANCHRVRTARRRDS